MSNASDHAVQPELETLLDRISLAQEEGSGTAKWMWLHLAVNTFAADTGDAFSRDRPIASGF